jgi:hypothetical protein
LTRQTAGPEKPKEPRPKPSEKFIKSCFVPTTDSFYRLQDGFAEDGWVLNQAQDLAVKMTLNQMGWKNQLAIDQKLESSPAETATDDEYKATLFKWSAWLEWWLSERRWSKIKHRLTAVLANCLTDEQVIVLVELAWTKLPKSYYDIFAEAARKRLTQIATKEKQEYVPTATPEVFEPQAPEASDELMDQEGEEEAPPAPTIPTTSTVSSPVDQAVLDYAVRALGKSSDFKKLMQFWQESEPRIKNHPLMLQACQDWVSVMLRDAQYQAQVDGVLETIPAAWNVSPEMMTAWKDRYSQLAPF